MTFPFLFPGYLLTPAISEGKSALGSSMCGIPRFFCLHFNFKKLSLLNLIPEVKKILAMILSLAQMGPTSNIKHFCWMLNVVWRVCYTISSMLDGCNVWTCSTFHPTSNMFYTFLRTFNIQHPTFLRSNVISNSNRTFWLHLFIVCFGFEYFGIVSSLGLRQFLEPLIWTPHLDPLMDTHMDPKLFRLFWKKNSLSV